MKKILLAVSLAAMAAPAYAVDTLVITLGANIPQSCGLLGPGGTPGDKALVHTANFNLAGVANGTEVHATGDNFSGAFLNISAFCNKASGAHFTYTVNPLLRTDGVATNLADRIDFRPVVGIAAQTAGYFGASPAVTLPAIYGSDPLVERTAGGAVAGNLPQAFATTGTVAFYAKGVQLPDGSYTKHAGPYTGSFTLTLTPNG